MAKEKKINVEFWMGYPGKALYYKEKHDKDGVDALMKEYAEKAVACMKENNPDHVLYAIRHIGIFKRICFYEPQPMTNEEFNSHFAHQGDRQIYAIHNTAFDGNDDEKNEKDCKNDNDVTDAEPNAEKPQNEQVSEAQNDNFWEIPEQTKQEGKE